MWKIQKQVRKRGERTNEWRKKKLGAAAINKQTTKKTLKNGKWKTIAHCLSNYTRIAALQQWQRQIKRTPTNAKGLEKDIAHRHRGTREAGRHPSFLAHMRQLKRIWPNKYFNENEPNGWSQREYLWDYKISPPHGQSETLYPTAQLSNNFNKFKI